MAQYRKFFVALIGAVVFFVNKFFGTSISIDATQFIEVAIPVLTALGVWAVPNKQK